ncbi:MAG TPA: hypothetical protein VJV78_20395, partial [Polyangiales bacterium]|nr:hypothetical protein [Polyangiales bacterium]
VTTDGGMPVWPDGGVVGVDAGVSCSTDGVYPTDVNAYDQNGLRVLHGCKRVRGNVFIGGNAIESLADLSDLSTVDGQLQISSSVFNDSSSSQLVSLKGLENLRSVGALSLSRLPLVPDLQPLSGLESAQTVEINRMDGLRNLEGLGKLSWQNVTITENSKLEALDGLHAPDGVSAVLLSGNSVLSSVKALSGLRKIGTLSLTQLDSLKSLDGLQGIQPGYDQLSIVECKALTDLTGLGAFPNVFEINSNAELRSLAGPMPALQLVSATIWGNPKLESIGGFVAPGPQAQAEIVLQSLPSLKSLSDLKGLQQVSGLGIGTCDALKDLTGLEALTSGQVIALLDNAGLSSLKGLDALQTLEQGLRIEMSPALTSLQGMPKLQRLGNLAILGSNGLKNLQGLEALTAIGNLELSGNLGLTSLQGLEKLTEAEGISISANLALANLMGLSGVQQLSQLSVSGNASLKNLQGLALRTVTELGIDNNGALTDLTGLETLTSISSSFNVQSNASLISLRALSALTSAGSMYVADNRRLPQCEVEWLAKRLNIPVSMDTPNGPPGTCAP